MAEAVQDARKNNINMPSPITISSCKQNASAHMANEEFSESYRCLDAAMTSSGLNLQLQQECNELAGTLLAKHFAVAISKTNALAPPESEEDLPLATSAEIKWAHKLQVPWRVLVGIRIQIIEYEYT